MPTALHLAVICPTVDRSDGCSWSAAAAATYGESLPHGAALDEQLHEPTVLTAVKQLQRRN